MDPDSKNFSPDLSKTFFRSKKVQITASNELCQIRGENKKISSQDRQKSLDFIQPN